MFSGHSGPVTAGAFTPDGKHVVSVGGDNDCSLRVWNPKTGECVSTLQGHPYHQEGITCLGVHQDGSVVITGAQDGSVAVSNIHNSRVVASLQGEGGGAARPFRQVCHVCCAAPWYAYLSSGQCDHQWQLVNQSLSLGTHSGYRADEL